MNEDQITIEFAGKSNIQNCVKLAVERDYVISRPKRHQYWKRLFSKLVFSKKLLIAFLKKELVGFCYFSPFLFEDNRFSQTESPRFLNGPGQ